MNQELINKLQYYYAEQEEGDPLPLQLQEAIQIISNYFVNNSGNKICLVFPSKEFTSQWISFVLALQIIEQDFRQFNSEIFKAYEQYKPGQKLLLNNKAVVEWVTGNEEEIKFKTKGRSIKSRPWENTQGDIITIRTSRIVTLRPAPKGRNVLSARDCVYRNLSGLSQTPIDALLSINTCDNLIFQKNSIALVSKLVDFEEAYNQLLINGFKPDEYFSTSKIDESGNSTFKSPLLIANNLSNVKLYSVVNPITKIIIDGIAPIHERITDFADIDAKNIPTILITDLSEMERFGTIGEIGFDFFNFTKENLVIPNPKTLSPFRPFDIKLRNYISFNVIKEICQESELEEIFQNINSIEKDETNHDLILLKIGLIQLINHVSRISHVLSTIEITKLNSKIDSIEALFFRCRMRLGNSISAIENSILLFRTLINKYAKHPSDKCSRLLALMNQKKYDYLICSTEEEAKALENSLHTRIYNSRVISVADVNDRLLSNKPKKAILTGWPKSNNINRLLSSFVFSELSVLFYQFENKYYNSLQRKNIKNIEKINATINNMGKRIESKIPGKKSFDGIYRIEDSVESILDGSFDILDFELNLEKSQYSKYAAKGNLIDSIKAKRILFESENFLYASESHKFLVINELLDRKHGKANLQRRKVDSLLTGDVIAIINTDRDILVELVEKNTNQQELASVKRWTELWKKVLKDYYNSTGNDFKKLVEGLRKNDCSKHEVTIRTWLQDESRIGPDDNSDLISIALMTNSDLLYNNIDKVREAISKMTGWRMKAADYIIDKIKVQMREFADNTIINTKVLVEGLGKVIFLKVVEVSDEWENIDVRYVNRLLQKEIL